MARHQNGVNGNIPNQPYGVFMAQQIPRNQNLSYYTDNIQVLQNQCVPQAYSNQINQNAMRMTQPMINQPQYAYYPQYPASFSPQQSQFSQFQYGQTFIQNQQFPYAQETLNTVPLPHPPANRKSSPLIVVDPINKTELNFQNQTTTEKKTKPLVYSSQLDFTEKIVKEEIKESHQNNEDKKLENIIEDKNENVDEIKEIEQHEEISDQKYTEPENIMTKDNDTIQCKENIMHDNTETFQSKENLIQENMEGNGKELSNILENNAEVSENLINDECNTTETYPEDIPKIESSIESEDIEDDQNIQGTINDDAAIMLTEKDSPNYFLQIDKKESDATTLRRKLIYDREYLITIKSNSRSQKKPQNLLENCDFLEEIIYHESQNISCKKPEKHFSSSNNIFKKPAMKNIGNNYSKHPKVMPKLITLNDTSNPIFERLKSSYLPPQLRSKEKDVDPYNELKRNIKCNLNKITPQNFQDCLCEISKLNIKEKDEMSCLINEIFIKAVQEEAYSVTYAQFCNKLSLVYTENQTFKGQLLKKCQDMFQTPIQEQLDNVRKEWILKIENELDAKMKGLYESDLEEQVKKAKDKYFGNIRFIGELFLHQLLAGKVILNCIVELLKGKNDSDALLALCKLMETCGKQIDDRHKEHMNSFFRTMDDLSKSKELDTRIRFKLRDIIDMRQRNWILRHIQQEKKINPKTLEEQKEEALAEANSKLIASQASIKKSTRNVQQNSVRRQISAPQKPIAVKGLTFTPHVVDNKTVLGPTKSNWTAGSGSKPRSHDADEWTPMQNKLINNSSRSREHSPQVKIKNKYGTLESSAEASGADSRPSSPPIRFPANVTKAYRIKRDEKPAMTDEERADIIFNDLLLTGTFDNESWSRINNVQRIIEKWIDDMMEKDVDCRRTIGDCFMKLINDEIITYELLIKSIRTFVSCIDDLICDIPKLWDFFAQFLERFICDKNSYISFIDNIFKELLPSKDVSRCISMTLHAASSRLGHNIVGHVFHKSSLKWECIVPNEWEKFVEQNDLHFTIAGGAPLSRCGGYSLQSISVELQSMLSQDMPNEAIIAYLEKHIDKPTWKSCECSRTITSCIIKAIQSKNHSIVRSYLNDKFEIIKLVSQSKMDNEIEVLKSILDVAHEVDNEILTIIYDVIMTRKIVSNEAFNSYLSNHSIKSEPNFDLTSPIIIELLR